MSESLPTTLKLPEKARAALAETLAEVQKAQADFQKVQASFNKQIVIACDFLGLDPALNHKVDFQTGIVTPAAAPETSVEPTPIRGEDRGN